jgi:serralysin
MKSKFITDPLDPSDGFLNPDGAEVYTSFFPAAGNNVGNPFASVPPVILPTPTPTLPAEAVVAESAQNGLGGPGSVVAETSGSGITINLLFDTAAMAAPASFRAGIEQAASVLSATITNQITVNIKIDYSGTGGGASAGPDNGLYESYSTVKTDLINNAASGDTTFNALPTGSTIQGQSSVAVWNAQLKLFGLLGANDTTTDDGSATFATDINSGLLVGVALHELTHAMGRVPYGSSYDSSPDIFDLFRFTSPGTRLIDGGNTAQAAYFSVDGGNTKLADFGQNSDPSDFLNSGVQGANDPFNEFYSGGTLQSLTTVDKVLLDALGFHTTTPATTTVIESFGSTSLVKVGSNYYLDSISTGTGPELKFGSAAVVAGQFGNIAPIGAEQTGSGYDVAWKMPGTDQFTFWTTDGNGNYTSNITGLVLGTSLAVEALETTFGQDLNGDGTIGVTASLIKTDGSTNLLQVADTYYVDVAGAGLELKYGGAGVTVGEFGSIAPIGAVQTASGYDIAWKIPGTNELTFWATDSNGNYTSNITGLVAGTTFAVESLESTFGQDLNGDGTIGVTSSLIKTDVSTSLLQIADTYYVYVGGVGPELKYGGSPVTVGEFGIITPIGAVQTASGYDIAWQISGTNEFTFWTIDSNGNYTSNITNGLASGTDPTLKSFETLFHQDFNGNGAIGNSAASATLTLATTAAVPDSTPEALTGSTLTLEASPAFNGHIVGFAGDGTLQGSDQINLRGISFNSIHSAYDSSTGILAVNDGTNTTDLHFVGNYMQDSFKFANDGDGGSVVYVQTGASQPSLTSGNAIQIQLAGNASTAGQDTFVFASNFGQATISNFAPATDTIEISKTVFANIGALLAATHDDAHGNAVITDAAHDTITIQNATTAQLQAHQSDFHLV